MRYTAVLLSLCVYAAGVHTTAFSESSGADFDRAAAVQRLQVRLGAYDDYENRSTRLYLRNQLHENLVERRNALGMRPVLDNLKDDALRIVDVNPRDVAALDAIRVALITHPVPYTGQARRSNQHPVWSGAEGQVHTRLMGLLLQHHLQRPQVLKVLSEVTLSNPADEQLWEKVYASSPDRDVRGNAAARLAQKYYGQLNSAQLSDAERQTLRAQAQKYAQVVRKEYSDVYGVRGVVEMPTEAGTDPRLLELVDWNEVELAHSVGATLPDIEVATIEGGVDRLSHHQGKVLLLDFWATWCGGCVAAHPDLVALKKELTGRPFEIIGISADDTAAVVVSYMKKQTLPWVNWFTGPRSALIRAWGINGFPTYLIVDPQGRVHERTQHLKTESKDYIRRLVTEAERSGSRS